MYHSGNAHHSERNVLFTTVAATIILRSVKARRPFWGQIEAYRLTLVVLFSAVGLIARFAFRFPLAIVAAFVLLMLMALGYSIYRIIEERKKPGID